MWLHIEQQHEHSALEKQPSAWLEIQPKTAPMAMHYVPHYWQRVEKVSSLRCVWTDRE